MRSGNATTDCLFCGKPFAANQHQWTLKLPMGNRFPLHRGCAPKEHQRLRKLHGTEATTFPQDGAA